MTSDSFTDDYDPDREVVGLDMYEFVTISIIYL